MKEEFLSKVKALYREEDFHNIEKAYVFAEEAHKEQKRFSGEKYIIHPVKVCDTLIDLGMDASTIMAALMHDVLEDTAVSEKQMEEEFGKEILDMVQAVTKLTRLSYQSKEEEQAENIRKLFFAMAKDIRVLIIKLADRLHNMRTLVFLPREKQIKKAKETLDIFAPLAGRLGISNIKCELEDLAMKYIYPEDYEMIAKYINIKRDERMIFVDKLAKMIEQRLKDSGINGEVKGRPKHFYSIFKKMKTQGKTFDQIYDLVAVRVIVENIRDCYTVLGDIHSIWKPIPGRFKDYIAMPKPNFYQSLHTTVVTNFGQVFEIQIRTFEMNKVAEYGIAAHWKYKEGKITRNTSEIDNKLGWIKQVMDVQGDLKDSIEFVDTLKLNVSSNEIFVFSPKGDVFDLPVGSTCIDFAYRLHSQVGNKCVGAKINKKIVPLNTKLSNGDVIEIMTLNNSKGPSRDWIKFVKTPNAKAKIRSFFKKAMKEENIKTGREMLEKEAKHRGYNLYDLLQQNWIKIILERYNFSELNDMYASIGYGGISSNQILFKLIEFYKKSQENNIKITERGNETRELSNKKNSLGILIEGYDDFLIRLGHCCNPVPGDKIVGYVSRGRGVSVHREDCTNMKNIEKERLLKATWINQNENNNSSFVASLRIDCNDKNGMLGQISAAISSAKFSISHLEARILKPKEKAIINIGIEVKNLEEVEYLIKKISGVDGVIKVNRNR